MRRTRAAYLPLYRHDNRAEVAASMPIFNERGLVPPKLPKCPVPVSCGDPYGEEGNEESKATLEGVEETSPPRQSELLRAFSDDEVAGERVVEGSPCPTEVVTRSGGTP